MTHTPEPDEALQALRRAVLRKLATGVAGERWREVGSETLQERYSLRQAAVSGAYRDLFDDAAERIAQHETKVGKAAFEAEGRAAGRTLAELRDELQRDKLRRQRGEDASLGPH